MEKAAYAQEAIVEETHWWFVGRRRLFSREIASLGLSREVRVLDVGISTGTNLRMLRDLGFNDVVGVDLSEDALRHCLEKSLGPLLRADVCHLPFADQAFDLVLATDIIEHVEDDTRALQELRRVTHRNGCILITVPAFEELWGRQDELAHHRRRYRKAELLARIEAAGLITQRSYYFNFFLFAPIWLARWVIRIARVPLESENQVNGPALNAVLGWVFRADCRLSPVLNPPFGVSVLALVQHDGRGIPSPMI